MKYPRAAQSGRWIPLRNGKEPDLYELGTEGGVVHGAAFW